MLAERVFPARSIAPDARAWKQRTRQAHVLHVFPRTCNLVNEAGELLSLVADCGGNGPFSIVLSSPEPGFSDFVTRDSWVQVAPEQLSVGGLRVTTNGAALWDPRPDWEQLYPDSGRLIGRLYSFSDWIAARAPVRSLMHEAVPVSNSMRRAMADLCRAVVQLDLEDARKSTGGIAGAGIGLTPAGDDFLLGCMLAAWMIHPASQAHALGTVIAQTATARTTTLSAAYLRCAARGQATEPWHALLCALQGGETRQITASLSELLSTGHTSGADALHGFLSVVSVAAGLGGPHRPTGLFYTS